MEGRGYRRFCDDLGPGTIKQAHCILPGMPGSDSGAVDCGGSFGIYQPPDLDHASIFTATVADGFRGAPELLFNLFVRNLRDSPLHRRRSPLGTIVRAASGHPAARCDEGSPAYDCGGRSDAGMESKNKSVRVGLAATGSRRAVPFRVEFCDVAGHQTDPLARNSLRIALAEYDSHCQTLIPSRWRSSLRFAAEYSESPAKP